MMDVLRGILAYDFVNGAYDWILSILSALFALSYPLILGCIERVDVKYHSTKLSARLMNETSFFWFRDFLMVNLIASLVSVFAMDNCGEEQQSMIMGFHLLLMLILLVSVFLFFRTIQTYYNVEELQKKIVRDYNKAVKHQNKKNEEQYFTQFADLSQVLLLSADNHIVRSVYDMWYAYISRKYKENPSGKLICDVYFYEAISRINENLCKQERRPVSLNNGNTILVSLLYGDSIETELTYQYLWKNLRIQLFYDREEWIMAYWTFATSKAMTINYKKGEFEFGEEREVNEKKKQERICQFEEFTEFHVMLCAMLLQNEKFNLLQMLLTYTPSEPPSYPLVPSEMFAILSLAKRIHDSNEWAFERRYPMQVMRGITGGRTLNAANSFLALLIYRLYSLRDRAEYDYRYRGDYSFSMGRLPETLSELLSLKRTVSQLLFWLRKVAQDERALSLIGIPDFGKIKNIYNPSELLNGFLSEIDEAIRKQREEFIPGESKVSAMGAKIVSDIECAMKVYEDFYEDNMSGEERWYDLNSSIVNWYPTAAFADNDETAYAGVAESMSARILNNFYYLFASAFYQEKSTIDYFVSYESLFEVLDKLNINEKYYAIGFGVLSDLLPNINGLEQLSDRKFIYKGMPIVLLICPTDVFSRRMYIMKREDIPVLGFESPKEGQKQKYSLQKESSSELWLSIWRAKDRPDLIPKRIEDEIGLDKIKNFSAFSAFWHPRIGFTSNTMICLKVNYQTYDGATNSNLDDIKPLD